MRLQHSKTRLGTKAALLGALLSLGAACGKKSESEDIPPKVTDLALSDAPEDIAERQKKWDALAAALGIGNNQAETAEQLVAQLATPSALLVDRSRTSDLQALLGRLGQKHVADAYKTRCAAVVGATKLSTAFVPSPTGGAPVAFPAANVYVLRYKLQALRSGAAETVTRAGLLVLPATPSRSAPLVAYAHGGDAGLAYGEIATVFGALQASHVIVAPTFPGEALCKTGVDAAARSCDANGALVAAETEAAPYDGDADELLGIQDCVTRATFVKNPMTGELAEGQGALAVPLLNELGEATGGTLNAQLALTVKPLGGSSPLAALPATIAVGASRGGLVSSLALAKSGAAMQAFNADKTLLGAGYLRPSFVSCAASLSAPAALTVGELRLALEHAVKGTYDQTSFTRLPGYKDLGGLFAEYRAGTMSVEDAAALVAARDLTLSGALYLGALRDWGALEPTKPLGGKGAALFLHGTLDKVFPFTHTRLAFNILTGIGSQPILSSVAPGVNLLARGVAPIAAFLADDGTLAAGYLDHGDLAFLKGTTVVPADFVSKALTSQPFADAVLEAKAKGLAAALFAGDTSDERLTEARALMISGQISLKAGDDGVVLDDKANLVGVGLPEAVGSWLSSACAL